MVYNAKKSYSKLKKGLNYLNTLSGKRVNLVVTEAHDSFNGSLIDDTIYIGADTFENDTWAETLVHEYTHFAEGTKEYQELMDALTGDSKLVEKTLSDIFEKAGYGFDKDKTIELLNRYERLQNSKNKTPNIDSNEEIRYNRKKIARYISYDKIGTESVNYISSELRSVYEGVDGCVADGIAIEQGNYVYIVDSGKENGKIDFGIRRKIKISNEKVRAEFIRGKNNDAVSKGYVSNELSSRIGDGLVSDRRRNMRRESGTELPTDSRESPNNQSRILGEDANNRGLNTTVDNEVLEELTEDELKYIRLYKSELGAHLSANMLGTESFIDKLVRENTTIAEKILNKLSDLKQMFERLGNAEARAEYKKIKKAEKLYLSAVEKAGYAYVGRKIVGAINEREEESKFNYKDDNEPEKQFQADYEKNVDAVLNGTYTGDNVIVVGRTPKVLTDIGLNQLPLAITANHIYTIAKTEAEAKAEGRYSKNNNYHGLGETAVKQIREKIKEPVMVLTHQEVTPEQQKSHAQSKRIVVVVELVIDGKQVICPIEVDTSLKYDGGRIDSNLITTYFSKSTFNELLKECIAKENIGETGFYYINKTKANNLLQGPGYQLPQQLASRLSASNTIIRHISENVNRKISDFTQSQQFKRWFGDWQNMPNRASKVVNSDGTPKIVYHGTDEKFTVFDITKSRSYDETVNYDLPGFYFSESLDESSSYGNIGEYYISIKNPYDGDIYKLAKEKGSYRKAYDYLVSKGYDGVIITELGEGFTEYIVFKPEQIKSATDNIGTFDRGNPDIRFNLKSNGKITKSRGEYQKLKADYTKKKKYDKKDVSKAVLDVPYVSTLPKATQNDIIESMWYSLNTIEGDNQKARFINLYCNSILRDLWQESKSFAELSTDEIREIEQKLYKTVRNIVKIGGSPSYLSKVEAQYAKTEAGRWRKKFLEDEEWNKIVGLLMH